MNKIRQEKSIMSNWIQEEISGCKMSDKRLNNRLESILKTLSRDPQKSIPNNCKVWSETQATYRFLSNESVSANEILQGHSQATVNRVKDHSVVLVAQDTTFINLATEDRKKEMGTLVCKNKNEFLLHPSVVFTPDRTNLGVLHHTLWKRPEGNAADRYHTPIEEKESYRWITSYQMSCQLQKQYPETLVVNIGDRESDIYELFLENEKTEIQARAEYIIRAKSNRLIESDEEDNSYLWNEMSEQPSVGTYQLSLQRTKYRRAREATFEIRIKEVTFTHGRRKGGNLRPVSVFAVLAKEINQPDDEKAITWMLLTSLPVETLEQAQTIVGWYRARWEIEIYFRVLKSGCKVEELRLESDERIEKAFAIYMIIAWRLHNMTMFAREQPETPCNKILDDKEWQLIYTLQKKQKPLGVPSVKEIVRLLAMRGGFLGRKGDGEPGAETIWRGYVKILNYLEIAEELNSIRQSNICV